MSFANSAAVEALRTKIKLDGRSLRDISVAERLQTSREVLAALVTDGQIDGRVSAIVLPLIDGVSGLLGQFEQAVNPPSALDAQYLDSMFADVAKTLQGLLELVQGNSKSLPAKSYRNSLVEASLELALGGEDGIFNAKKPAHLLALSCATPAANADDVTDAEFVTDENNPAGNSATLDGFGADDLGNTEDDRDDN